MTRFFRTHLLLVILSLFCSSYALSQTSPASAPNAQLQSCAGIMPLGDSITVGVNGGYRNTLYNGLQQNNCGVSFAGTQSDANTRVPDKHHEGHPYFSIADITNNVNNWLASVQPNIVTLMVGTNDIASWSAETAEQIGARHDKLIDKIRSARPDAWIFVASIPPQTQMLIQPNNVDRSVLDLQFNDVVRRNVETRIASGQRVRFVDVNSALTTSDLSDGIHPTEAGYEKMAQRFLESIRTALSSSPSSPPPLSSSQPAPAPAVAEPAPPSPTVVAAPAPSQSNGGGSMGWGSVFWLLAPLLGARGRRTQ